MDNDALFKIVPVAITIALGFVVLATIVVFGLVRHFRRKAMDSEIYPKLAAAAGWSYSPGPFPAVKGAIDYIDKKMFPDTLMFSSPAKNILSGNSGTTSFAIFDYSYSLATRYGRSVNISAAVPRMMHERCVFVITRNPAIPEFAIDQKHEIVRAFNFVAGDHGDAFENKFKLIGSNAFFAQMLPPLVQAFILRADIIRIFGNQNFLCVFFERNENAVPDAGRSRSQLDTVFKLSEMLGMTHTK